MFCGTMERLSGNGTLQEQVVGLNANHRSYVQIVHFVIFFGFACYSVQDPPLDIESMDVFGRSFRDSVPMYP